MKKFLLLLSAAALVACSSHERKITEKKLESSLKCPSTLKILSYEQEEIPQLPDTSVFYHIAHIYGDAYPEFARIKGFFSIDSVRVDSIARIISMPIPGQICQFIYDCQNEYSAVIRDTAIYYYLNDSTVYTYFDYFITYGMPSTYDTITEPYSKTYTNPKDIMGYDPDGVPEWTTEYYLDRDYKFSWEED